MKLEKKQMFWIISLSILVVLMLNNLGYINLPKFAISDSDFVLVNEATVNWDSMQNVTFINGTITIPLYGAFNSGDSFYFVLNSSLECSGLGQFSKTIPNPEGTHKICKYVFSSVNNNTQMKTQLYSTIYTKEIEQVEVAGPIEYIQNLSYINNTVYQNVTVEKLVPTETTLFGIKISWIAILEGIILGGIIIFLINWGRRK